MKVVRLKPPPGTRVLDDHDVDAIALELGDDGELQDFRLELGRSFDIVWVLPIEPGGRLRAILVDNAVAHVDLEVRMDPCEVELRLAWEGELARFGERVLVRVEVELRGAAYACTADVRERDGTITTRTVRSAPTPRSPP
jgi:hypothetical protein